MTEVLVLDDSEVDRRLIGGLIGTDSDLEVRYAAAGDEALESLQQGLPDLVVTDLQMPGMDGLQFVRAARIRFPSLPVVIVTAFGSEETAMKALESGAASYVPKSRLAATLQDTVRQVLAHSRATRGFECLGAAADELDLSFRLENDPACLEPLTELIQQLIVGRGLRDASFGVCISVALEEVLVNAIYRGNLAINRDDIEVARENLVLGKGYSLLQERRTDSRYCDRRVHVRIQLGTEGATIVVRDDGDGFDVQSLPSPDDPGALEQDGVRGLHLVRAFMDDVTFNDAGNEVTLSLRPQLAEC